MEHETRIILHPSIISFTPRIDITTNSEYDYVLFYISRNRERNGNSKLLYFISRNFRFNALTSLCFIYDVQYSNILDTYIANKYVTN